MNEIPKLFGWDFSEEEVEKAARENRMLLLDIETSNICNLRCPYCYRDVYGGKQKLDNELTLNERKSVIDQARELGCRTVKIAGAGEPLLDPVFWKQVEYAIKKGMNIIFFTNGIALDEKNVKKLASMNVSVILKYNSNNQQVEDKLVGLLGYAKSRKRAFDLLLKYGFNRTKPTRLGIDSVITEFNKEEILDLFQYFRDENVFPIIKPFMPLGGALRVKGWEVSRDEALALFKKSQEIDRKKYGIDYDFSFTYMGAPCDQRRYALYVDITGKVFLCTGSSNLLGNIRNDKLADIWNSPDLKKIRQQKYNCCIPREQYWSKKSE
ncbi:MAG: radical SAM protein [Candidatus Aenigmarchaeota archaeon]|nr:radical SAM protein [Candidatus Aenigmarchaeota archaeon]